MSSRKKSTTSTESSSGSTSDSSSNSSSSSSGSESGSSSSDSESSSSQDAPPPSRNNSTSSQAKQHDKNARRRSSETVSSAKGSQNSDKNNGPPNKLKDKAGASGASGGANNASSKISQSNKIVKQPPPVYSSDDDVGSGPPKSISNKSTDINKKKAQAIYKPKTAVPANTGGKAPPSVVKQAKLANIRVPAQTKKAIEKSSSSSSTANSNSSKSKKKSIFSPENTSRSEDDDDDPPPQPVKKVIASNVSKSLIAASVNKSSRATKVKEPNPPPMRPKPKPLVEKEKIIVKSSESSETSSTSATSSSSDSDSDSSVDSTPAQKKATAQKKTANVKQTHSATKTTDTSKNNSDSETENNKPSVVRKLTRSASTRKSRHLTGKAASETDSDADSVKRSLSKSPVKKAPVVTKGKTKNKRSEMKIIENNVVTPPIPEERKCPLDGCDTLGHLSGKFDKHFIIDACPIYHNLTATQTKEQYFERKKREEECKKLISSYNSATNGDQNKKQNQLMEQKINLQKIKDLRNKFKPMSPPPPSILNISSSTEKEREPCLDGLVSDYDLQLFREAQAIASENIENELNGLPSSRGTKYISMGKHCMEVWYQSPYPADAARLPKLYICEFCLRYQKSEVGMKRHGAKCVWRHPPGDEIYRKGKLGVWQVDGKRHKQYCQHLCLLAKFFLDHKTLYYDVEPFLFYVMTLVDSEGCHTVGYFSKEKNSFLNYNVSCILTLPPYQRQGYGRLLIDFSYLLTRVEGKIGSPEKPLSDLGLISYRSYWKDVLLDYLCSRSGTTLSIKDVSQEMAINSYDIVSTLQALGMMKYWKGKHIILKKQDVLEEYADRVKKRGAVLKIDPECLSWTPFVPPVQTGPS